LKTRDKQKSKNLINNYDGKNSSSKFDPRSWSCFVSLFLKFFKVFKSFNLLGSFRCRCPAHSQAYSGPILLNQNGHGMQTSTKPSTDYAFEVKQNNIQNEMAPGRLRAGSGQAPGSLWAGSGQTPCWLQAGSVQAPCRFRRGSGQAPGRLRVAARLPAGSGQALGMFWAGSGPPGRLRAGSSQVRSGSTVLKAEMFQMACSNIRYGPGVTAEIGMDLANMKAKHVGVYTDKTVAQLAPMKTTVESLTKAGVNFSVYDDVRVEPTDARYTMQKIFLFFLIGFFF
jgi:hypothetical protein